MIRARGLVCLAAAALVPTALAGCSSSSSTTSATVYLAAGQLPASEIPAGGKTTAAGSATTTIPLAQQNPLTELFQDLGVFQGCLQALGVKFIGVPDQHGDPSSPVNDPNYVKALQKCAAQSNIVQALKDVQNSENHLTPAQIAKANKLYLQWRLCMIGRGWTIPMPKPDSNGRLFSLGSSGSGGGPEMQPPPGQSILSSGDMEDCANKVGATGNSSIGG